MNLFTNSNIYNNESNVKFTINKDNDEFLVKIYPDFRRDNYDIQIIVNDEIFYLSLFGIIDFKEEGDRLTKNLSKISKEIDKISSKLESRNFIENAPKNIILEQKERLEEYMSSKSKIEDAIKSFSN